jgi:hypothetical protein
MLWVSVRAPFARSVGSLPIALALAGCSLVHHETAGVDAGVVDAAVAVLVIDAAPPPPPPPDNVNEVGRFPDEVSLNETAAKIADANVSARNAVPGGALVATLRIGTPVTQVAKHESFILCTFADAKNPARILEGWVAEQAFVPGPTLPNKAACPTGQTRLMFDEQDFCGRQCKAQSDCPSGQVCTGKASLFVNGKVGAEVATCTLPLTPSPTPSASAAPAPLIPLPFNTANPVPIGLLPKVVPNVQVFPLPGNACPPGFLLGDKQLCHRDCSRSPCPAGSRCVREPGGMVCDAL